VAGLTSSTSVIMYASSNGDIADMVLPRYNISQGGHSEVINESQISSAENSGQPTVNEYVNTPITSVNAPSWSKNNGTISVDEAVITSTTIRNETSRSNNSVHSKVNEAVNTLTTGLKAPSQSKSRGRPRKYRYMNGLDSAIARMKRYRQQQ
jgi:hypothetical protein